MLRDLTPTVLACLVLAVCDGALVSGASGADVGHASAGRGAEASSPSALTASPVSHDVVVVPGTAWRRHTIDDSSRGADGAKLGDINGDGWLDVVTSWEEGGLVRVALHPGPGPVREPWPRVTVGRAKNVEEAIFADLDGDGRLDVVSGTEGKTRTMYWHRFSGSAGDVLDADRWQTQAIPITAGAQMWIQAVALDLDGRDGIDLLVGSKGHSAAVGWLQSPARAGDLAAWRYHRLRDAGWIMSLLPHDMDGDGDADVVFTDRQGARAGVGWLENPGQQGNRAHRPWREHAIGASGREVMFADIGDVDGDGSMDLAVAVKPGQITLFMRQDGGWKEQVLSLDTSNLGDAKAVKIADLNGDRLADLLFACENARGEREGIVWLEQQRGQAWRQRTLGGPAGTKFDLMQAVDVDGDGDLDVITTEEADLLGVIWYENPR
jgi:hypothetical protein